MSDNNECVQSKEDVQPVAETPDKEFEPTIEEAVLASGLHRQYL